MMLMYPQRSLRYRPHRPRSPSRRRKTHKCPDNYAVDKRAVLKTAVGNGPLAVDNENSSDCKKVLQMSTLKVVRAMRAVFQGSSYIVH